MTADGFVKPVASARAGAWEAAGLAWLCVPDGAPVVGVKSLTTDQLVLERLSPVSPSASQVEAFGRRLAATHAAGASAFGAGPEGWSGDGLQGPADDLIPLPLASYDIWGAMYADLRVEPLARKAGLTSEASGLLDRLRRGEFDETVSAPARLHGDLWAGNVVWTSARGVLIDPAAHGGHPESDLGALTLFGAPHLERLLASYIEVAGVADGWRERLPLMQLHLVLLHAVLFGGGYVGQAASILRRYG